MRRAAPARRVRSCGLVLAALVLLAGCAGGGMPGPSPTHSAEALPDGVTVAVTQLRSDVADRQVQVQIHNGSDAVLTIGAVRLDDPRFDGPAPRVVDRTSRLSAGATVNVRVQLPEADCGVGDDAASTATIDYEIDGRTGTGTAGAPEVFPFLAAIHRRECVAQSVAEIADVEFGPFTPSAAGSPASLVLSIVPRNVNAGEVRFTDVRETNLLSFVGVADGALPLGAAVGADDQAAQTLTLPLVPARCDPHAVQEDKRGTVFTLDVEGDGEPGQFTLAADPDLKARLLTWVTQWCGYG
jgi:hypothetical protein